MGTPSGVTPSGFMFTLVSTVSPSDFQAATDALDRALLRQIGLPEEVEVRAFENAVIKLGEEFASVLKDFSLSKIIAILPSIVLDATALWEDLAPKISDKIMRKDFISKVVRYAYRKNDPDLPFLIEPFETMVEDMILNAVPGLVDNLEAKLAELAAKLKKLIS